MVTQEVPDHSGYAWTLLPTFPSQPCHGHLVERWKMTLPNRKGSVRMSVKMTRCREKALGSPLIEYLGSPNWCPPLGSSPRVVTGRWRGPSTRSRCTNKSKVVSSSAKMRRYKFQMKKQENPPHERCWAEKGGRCCNSPLTGDLK